MTAKMTCSACGGETQGKFCHHCGEALGGKFCNQCGAAITGDGKFCNQCGAAVRGAPSRKAGPAGAGGSRNTPRSGGASRTSEAVGTSNTAPWLFAGIAMFALIVVVGWNMVQPAGPAAPAGGGAPAGMSGGVNPNGPGTTDISQMSPREAADRLFNRVMEAAAAGDTVQAQGFMPMAMQAYQMAQPLDMDGLFHLALLQQTAGQLAESLTTTQGMLDADPNHILALGVAAGVNAELGRDDAAAALYRQILDNIGTERGRTLPEYQGHTNYLDSAVAEAQAFLAGR